MAGLLLTPSDLARDIEELNSNIHDHIDPRVFMVCNYNENLFEPISPDAVFETLVMELYKVFIDVNPVMKRLDYIIFGRKVDYRYWPNRFTVLYDGKKIDAENLFKHIRIVENLRSIYGHNNNELNGLYESNNIEYVYRWNRSCFRKALSCGKASVSVKSKPSSIEDYLILINYGLFPLWNECKAIINEIVNFISGSDKVKDIISRWIDEICNNYMQNPKYVRGQLAALILTSTRNKNRMNYFVDECYQNLASYNSMRLLRRIYKVYCTLKTDEDRFKYIKARDSIIKKSNGRQKAILEKAPKRNGIIDYERYYLDNILPRYLKNTIAEMSIEKELFLPNGYVVDNDKEFFDIWKTGKKSTDLPNSLLPHELLQEIVYQSFEGMVDEVCGIYEPDSLPPEWTIDL